MASYPYNPFDNLRSSVSSLSSTSSGIRASHILDVAINWSHVKLDNSELKEQIKRELIADLRNEGLIISKSPMKEMTEERMNRKIDQILENSNEKRESE
jgi:hypothetical protein